MKSIFILSLAICLFAVQIECKPGSNMNELYLALMKSYGGLKECSKGWYQSVQNYFIEDDLGHKLTDVLNTLAQRLNKRIKKVCP
ncbi:unnamed protein product [Schistosoma turkestanicum]|nr:unnamed protein product [Schistosoma turkestanicum]